MTRINLQSRSSLAAIALAFLIASMPAAASAPYVLIDQTGPLPISTTLTTGTTGPATLVVSGSVWTHEKNTQIGIDVVFDGQVVGSAVIFSNEPNTHRAVVSRYLPIDLDRPWPAATTPPSYTVELRAMNANTLSDLNDSFSLTLLED